jgi:hypothetical protein
VVKRVILFLNQKKVQLAARFILGGVFIYASLDKISFPREFANIVIKYRILPEKLAIYFAFLLPWVELLPGAINRLHIRFSLTREQKSAAAIYFVLPLISIR